jgi:endonuclease YncB( thermonuclease family)
MLKCGPACSFALLATAAFTAAGCGNSSQFKNEPRAPAPVQLTGVIRDDKLTVSPNRVGAGPVILFISNQTQQAHTITLEGVDTKDTVAPVNPLDTAKIQQTLKQGRYTVKAGSTQAVAREIKPATLSVGPQRRDSSNQVLLP